MSAGRNTRTGLFVCCLVPSARLELAQLSPLPPQDSVSTNFTTTALSCLGGMRNHSVLASQTVCDSTPEKPCYGVRCRISCVFIWLEFDLRQMLELRVR